MKYNTLLNYLFFFRKEDGKGLCDGGGNSWKVWKDMEARSEGVGMAKVAADARRARRRRNMRKVLLEEGLCSHGQGPELV